MNLKQQIGDFSAKIKSIFSHSRINKIVIVVLILAITPFMLFLISSSDEKQESIPEVDTFFDSAYEPDQLIVKLKTSYTEDDLMHLDSVFQELGVISQEKAYKNDKPYLNDFYLFKFKKGTDLRSAKKVLDATGKIDVSHPNYILQIQAATPNDPYYSQQWDLAKIGMPAVWDKTQGAENIKVAVLDTGIDYNNSDFVGRKIIRGPNYAHCGSRDRNGFCLTPPGSDPLDDHGHGSHVSGTIGASTNNGQGIAGMLWNTTIISIKTMKGNGRGDMSDNVDGIVDAMNLGAKVINMSLTSGEGTNLCQNVPELQDSIDDANERGIVIVVAAGNENQDASRESPPSCRGVIVVGATDNQDKRWRLSNYGPRVDISAPGTGIISTFSKNRFAINEGTSMAAPHVAAAAAILLSLNSSLTPQAVLSCLVNNADPISTDKYIGKRLNVEKAVNNCVGSNSLVNVTKVPTAIPVTKAPTIAQNQAPTATTTRMVNPTSNIRLSPIPVKTYKCRQATGSTPGGAIQIGNLVCTPNK